MWEYIQHFLSNNEKYPSGLSHDQVFLVKANPVIQILVIHNFKGLCFKTKLLLHHHVLRIQRTRSNAEPLPKKMGVACFSIWDEALRFIIPKNTSHSKLLKDKVQDKDLKAFNYTSVVPSLPTRTRGTLSGSTQ